MNEKQIETCKKIHNMGKWRYILLYGVVGWGLSTGVLFSLVMAYQSGWDRFLLFLTFSLIAFPFGGVVFGWILWKSNESRYKQLVADEQSGDIASAERSSKVHLTR